MMPECNRLGALEMRIARHYRTAVLLRFVAKHRNQICQLPVQRIARLAKIQTNVERHLVVSASCRMQAFARRADMRGQFPFDKGVNIFCVRVYFQCAAFDFGFYRR